MNRINSEMISINSHFFIFSFIGLLLGSGLGFLCYRIIYNWTLKSAQLEAFELEDDLKDFMEQKDSEEKALLADIELELWSKSEDELLKAEDKISELDEVYLERKNKVDQMKQQLVAENFEREREIQSSRDKLKNAQQKYENKIGSINESKALLQDKLSQQSGLSKNEILSQLVESIETETKQRNQKYIEAKIQDTSEHVEALGKRVLDAVLNRFMRPYCPERGISSVYFSDPQIKTLFIKESTRIISVIREVCGCDLIVEEGNDLIGVAGYDPVRRELTRRTLEKITKDKRNLFPDQVKRIAEQNKKDLFRQIKLDGDQLAKELGLQNLHPEIRQMMGSLRYRYSFTQNQYFHCGEVGWLCGLIASELTLNSSVARRSGMLHDIGKSMDHALDGGHAVIGADFIKERGESPEVVHNVRAHHYDEQPHSDIAFSVIAADAISGARPGARRSTIESYNQKVSELQDIARSFEGVTDCFILYGGRECRVLVNSKNTNDLQALELSKRIAKKVEEECNYPGQIKIVVVRETLTVETSQGHRV